MHWNIFAKYCKYIFVSVFQFVFVFVFMQSVNASRPVSLWSAYFLPYLCSTTFHICATPLFIFMLHYHWYLCYPPFDICTPLYFPRPGTWGKFLQWRLLWIVHSCALVHWSVLLYPILSWFYAFWPSRLKGIISFSQSAQKAGKHLHLGILIFKPQRGFFSILHGIVRCFCSI